MNPEKTEAQTEYADIIEHPAHVSCKRTPMPPLNRAAQFAPFAALVGYENLIAETSRLVDHRLKQDEGQIDYINRCLRYLEEHRGEEIEVRLRYYTADERKSGGSYQTVKDIVRKVDTYRKCVVLSSGKEIPMRDIQSIQSDSFPFEE